MVKLMWQDYIFTIGSLFFIVGLIPALRSVDKPPVKTSLITGFWLAVFALTYISLGLYLSMVVTAITSFCWFTLAWQKYRTHTLDRAFEEGWPAYTGR
jgi:uncharacterized membrane protein